MLVTAHNWLLQNLQRLGHFAFQYISTTVPTFGLLPFKRQSPDFGAGLIKGNSVSTDGGFACMQSEMTLPDQQQGMISVN